MMRNGIVFRMLSVEDCSEEDVPKSKKEIVTRKLKF